MKYKSCNALCRLAVHIMVSSTAIFHIKTTWLAHIWICIFSLCLKREIPEYLLGADYQLSYRFASRQYCICTPWGMPAGGIVHVAFHHMAWLLLGVGLGQILREPVQIHCWYQTGPRLKALWIVAGSARHILTRWINSLLKASRWITSIAYGLKCFGTALRI